MLRSAKERKARKEGYEGSLASRLEDDVEEDEEEEEEEEEEDNGD